MLSNILRAQQFDIATVENIFTVADTMKEMMQTKKGRIILSNQLQDKIICNYFHEPSTRTNLSFEAAALRLGAQVLNPPFPREFSSEVKGESFEDSICTISRYADCIVLRHKDEGIAEIAAEHSLVPIINAGDGSGQHPTQALLDLYTIKKLHGQINGTSIAMVGDLKNGRTVRSLCYLLGKFKDIKIYFLSPPELAMREDIIEYLVKHNIFYANLLHENSLKNILESVDFVYMTRIQKERITYEAEYRRLVGQYILTPEIMPKGDKPYIMHPLPRDSSSPKTMEISYSLDKDKRAVYFDQVENGLYIRMALLKLVMDYHSKK